MAFSTLRRVVIFTAVIVVLATGARVDDESKEEPAPQQSAQVAAPQQTPQAAAQETPEAAQAQAQVSQAPEAQAQAASTAQADATANKLAQAEGARDAAQEEVAQLKFGNEMRDAAQGAPTVFDEASVVHAHAANGHPGVAAWMAASESMKATNHTLASVAIAEGEKAIAATEFDHSSIRGDYIPQVTIQCPCKTYFLAGTINEAQLPSCIHMNNCDEKEMEGLEDLKPGAASAQAKE